MTHELDSTRCNFIRCIKPNASMTPGDFDPTYTVTQLRHTGLLQCCELLKHGYPTRIAYSEVTERYRPVLHQHAPAILHLPCLATSERLLTSAVLYGFEVPRHLYQLGSTKVFFRAGGVAALDDLRFCDMTERAPRLVQRVKRWVVLRRWRLAKAHVQVGICLLRHQRAVLAQRSWLFAARVLRIYVRGLRRIYLGMCRRRSATIIQAAARALAPRRTFIAHASHLFEARRAAERATAESAAAAHMQAVLRGHVQRHQYRKQLAEMAALKAQLPAATFIQSYFRGAKGRKDHQRRLAELLERLIPSALKLQQWWRVVLSEKVLRKLRSVVDRFVAAHRRLVDEVSGLHAQVDAALTELDGIAPPPAPSGPPPRNGGKRFEMWITLRVGLPEAIEAEAISRAGARADGGQGRTRASSRATGTPSRLASTPRMASSVSAEPSDGAAAAEGESGGSAQATASGGTQVFSVRSMALKKAGTHFRGAPPGSPHLTGPDWTGLDRTGLDWTGPDWTGLDRTGLDWTVHTSEVRPPLTLAPLPPPPQVTKHHQPPPPPPSPRVHSVG